MEEYMNKYLLIWLLFLVNTTVFPNDSRTIFGSSVEIIDNKNTNIIMQEEVINITLFRNYYEVDVMFTFYNSGESEEVLLGFPVESDYQHLVIGNREWAVLDNFKSYINGNLISEYDVKEEIIFPYGNTNSAYDYVINTRWYLRKILFLGHEVTISRVTYKAPYGHSASSLQNAGYIFGTGYNWKGPIGKMIINIKHSDDIILESFNIGRIKDNEIINYFTWVGDGQYKFEFINMEPIKTDRIRLFLRECKMFNATGNEFGHYRESWIWDEYLLYKNAADIKLYTKNQLRLFINFFYAIHGYNFNNIIYRNFYQKFRYKINPNFSENDFNEFERKNIDYLLRLEKMIP
jgi:hypothetical protein